MAITYRVDSELSVVFAVWTGDITADDLATHWTALVTDPQAMRCCGSVSDVRGAHQLPHYDALRDATQTRLRARLPGWWRAAVVAVEPHHRGIASQLAAIASHLCAVECFDEAELALAWVIGDRAPAEELRDPRGAHALWRIGHT